MIPRKWHSNSITPDHPDSAFYYYKDGSYACSNVFSGYTNAGLDIDIQGRGAYPVKIKQVITNAAGAVVDVSGDLEVVATGEAIAAATSWAPALAPAAAVGFTKPTATTSRSLAAAIEAICEIEDLGERQLKGMARPAAVARLRAVKTPPDADARG